MADVLIVGDGPAGLSAALFLAKNGLSTVVFGKNETPMHKAMVYNYLGLPEITGPEFQRVAREQVAAQGATILDLAATTVAHAASGFTVTAEDGSEHTGRYLVLATGTNRSLAQSLGCELGDGGGVTTDLNGRTAIDRLYVVGWSVRPMKTQAIISAGDGAAAALDILSAEKGKDLHDFDVLGS